MKSLRSQLGTRMGRYWTGDQEVSDSQAGLKGTLSTKPRSGQFRAIQYDCPFNQALDPSPPHHEPLYHSSHQDGQCNEFATHQQILSP
ncbi:hypothetical protein B0H12DRAFT_1143008 [Mycena haematopus]|nr:hypothetical protein B0H12DRAFT_1143008 [Mycena haematopus]